MHVQNALVSSCSSTNHSKTRLHCLPEGLPVRGCMPSSPQPMLHLVLSDHCWICSHFSDDCGSFLWWLVAPVVSAWNTLCRRVCSVLMIHPAWFNWPLLSVHRHVEGFLDDWKLLCWFPGRSLPVRNVDKDSFPWIFHASAIVSSSSWVVVTSSQELTSFAVSLSVCETFKCLAEPDAWIALQRRVH